jgi:hypothetical protein
LSGSFSENAPQNSNGLLEVSMTDSNELPINFETKGVTGRDGYIIAEALVLAMKAIDEMPDTMRLTADQHDIIKILNTAFPTWEDVLGPG